MKQLVNSRSVRVIILTMIAAFSLVLSACSTATNAPAADGKFVFGLVLVGPINDGGWSQAHYDAGKYVESKIPGSEMVYVDKVNPADRPNVKVEQVVDELIAKGAKLIITTSDDFKDGTREAAKAHPDVTFVHASGDDVLSGKAPANLGNTMGRMEYGKMIAGCAAALQSNTGNISFIGPLINDETRRLASSAYLGAQHCWSKVLGKDPAALKFNVTWIGFWFNIPGVTLDPTKVVNDFFAAGSDVVISGIDTPEAIIEAAKAKAAGKDVYALPYDFKDACSKGEDACLGVPYFNWVPAYTKIITSVKAGSWKQEWEWFGPDWADINNVDKSGIGFVKGKALSADNSAKLDGFITELAGGLNLWSGPLKLQDGSDYIKAGEVATDQQIWYMPQLLEGMTGQSVSEPSK